MTSASEIRSSAPAGRGGRFISTQLAAALLAGLDWLLIVGVAALSGVAYHYAYYGERFDSWAFAQSGALLGVFFVTFQFLKNEYTPRADRSYQHALRSSYFDWNFAFIILLIVAFLTKTSEDFSRGFVVVFYLLGFATIAGTRVAVMGAMRTGLRSGWLVANRVLVVGVESEGNRFRRRHGPAPDGLRIVDTLTLPDRWHAMPTGQLTINVERAVAHARMLDVEDILLLIPWADRKAVDYLVDAFLAVPASIHLGPDHDLERFGDITVSRLGDTRCLRLERAPLSWGKRLAKRLFDIAVASTALALLSPLLVLVAILIRLESPGPAFFLQRRLGFNDRVFRIVKFRTMTTMEDGVIRQATADDPRITRLGRFLRRWNIDELPQLFNVLAGSMSIVGPRPHALMHNDQYQQTIARYAHRHRVKPGITGWAQVNGYRGVTDSSAKMQARVRHDLFYIDNWSLWFDLYIVLMTLSPRAYRNAV